MGVQKASVWPCRPGVVLAAFSFLLSSSDGLARYSSATRARDPYSGRGYSDSSSGRAIDLGISMQGYH